MIAESNRPRMFSTARPERGERLFAVLTTLAFMLVTVPVALHHEMWRDELQAWLIARDSPSLASLFHSLRYEGHPALWYLLLRALTHVFDDPRTLQFVSLVCGAATVYLFALFAPFSRVIRALFAFGYFVVYGYTIVARSYSLEMLLLIVMCVLLTRERPRWLAAGGVMFLVANTSIYGTILVTAMISALVVDAIVGRSCALLRAASARSLALVLLPAVFGIILAISQVRTPADAPFHGNGLLTPSRSELLTAERLTSVWRAYVPIPSMGQVSDLGETNFLADRSPRAAALGAALSLVALLLAAISMRRSIVALVFFVTATTGMLLFSLAVFSGALRHQGHFFLALITALWLARGDGRSPHEPGALPSLTLWVDRYADALIIVLLCIQVAGGVPRLAGDYALPFSGGKDAVAYLRTHGLDHRQLVIYPGFIGTTLSGYLKRPVFSLDRGVATSFAPWEQRAARWDDTGVLAATEACCVQRGPGPILIMDHPLAASDARLVIRPLASFTTSIVGERFYLYGIEQRF